MKARDHEKIVADIDARYQRQIAILQQEIRRLRHLIELHEAGGHEPARALYEEYLQEKAARAVRP